MSCPLPERSFFVSLEPLGLGAAPPRSKQIGWSPAQVCRLSPGSPEQLLLQRRAVTDSDPTKDPNDPEYGVELPEGLRLERPASGGVRLELRLRPMNRALSALPRLALVGGVVFTLVQAWRHHVFVVFWFLGLPFLAWLRGPPRRAIVIDERQLEIEGMRRLGRSFIIPRSQIERIEIGRGGVYQMYQRALFVTLSDGRSAAILVGISAVQAEFVNGGLQRWLAGA